ncbi:hypothetical protein V1224_13765 [Lachnospiraceae bacterium JLR.KK008]
MLNEERIKLMTKMAAYEENEGRHNMTVGNYFRSDYISLQVMKSVISATLSFAIVVGIYVFYHFEEVMKEIYQIDLLEAGREFLLAYVIFTGIYTFISYFVYSYRYNRVKKSLKKYNSHLEELFELYEEDNRR